MERSDQDPRGAIGASVVVIALLATAAVVGRRLWFFSDDWNILAEYHSGNLLEPFNGHLSLLPAGIYQLLFNTVGVGSYLPYRLVGLAALCVLGFQVARFAGARVGAVGTVLAVAALMWNSFGVTNVMFPFLMNFSLPIAALIAIWWHLDAIDAISTAGPQSGDRKLLRHRVAAGIWLALALAASGLGVVAAFAVAVELLLRRAPLRLWAAWAVPTGAWLAWWLFNRGSSEISTDPTQVLPYFLRMLWAGPTSVAAGAAWAGLVIGLGLLGAVVAVSWRERSLDPRVAGALGAALAFAGLTALTRQDTFPPIPPDELRYGWTIGAYLVLAAVALAPALLRELGTPERASWTRPVGVAAAGLSAVVLVIGAVQLTDDMGEWTDQVAGAAPGLRTNLYAAEAVGPERMDPDAVIGPLSFVPVLAVDYLAAVEAVGSPLEGATGEEIGGRQDQRDAASELLFANVGLSGPEPSASTAPEGFEGCEPSLEALPGGTVDVFLPDPVAGSEPAQLRVSRFGGSPVVFELERSASSLVLPADAAVGTDVSEPYRLEVSGTGRLCPS